MSTVFHTAVRWLCLLLVLLSSTISFAADGFIDIAVPLREQRYYSLHSFLLECHRKLGTTCNLAAVPERELTLSPGEKAALLLTDRMDLLKVRFETDRLVLSIPDGQDDRVRRRVRHQLSRLINVPLDEWPATLGLHVPEKWDARRRTVLLTHGMEASAASLHGMREAFERWGAQVLIFDYPNDAPLAWSGERLRRDLGELATRHPELRLVMVAHSMGGLVVRHALEMPGDQLECVTDLFLLGTPNSGSQLASVQPWLELFQEIVPRPHQAFDSLIDGLGEAAEDLKPGSKFLLALNRQQRAAGVRYHTVMGNKSILSETERSALETEWLRICRQWNVPELTRTRILEMLQAPELKDRSGDGAVSLTSARLSDVQSEKVLELNHMQLLLPAEPTSEGSDVFGWIIDQLRLSEARDD